MDTGELLGRRAEEEAIRRKMYLVRIQPRCPICKNTCGACRQIQLIDPKDYLNNLDLPASKIKINICRDLLKELDELQEITFKLN